MPQRFYVLYNHKQDKYVCFCRQKSEQIPEKWCQILAFYGQGFQRVRGSGKNTDSLFNPASLTSAR